MVVTLKPIEAREVEARARAYDLRVRTAVVVYGKHYQCRSQCDATVTYNVDRTFAGWQCECEGYRWTGCCKHIGQVARRAEREGWAFGKIARVQV